MITLLASLGIMLSFAATPFTNFAACETNALQFLVLESWDSCLPREHGDPVLRDISDIWLIIVPIFNDALKLAGYIAAGFIIWGGIQYSKSQGDPANLKAAKDTIKNAIIGLVIVLLSIAVVQFIFRGFVQ